MERSEKPPFSWRCSVSRPTHAPHSSVAKPGIRMGAPPPTLRGWFEGRPPRRPARVTRPGGVVRQRRQPYSRRVGRSGAPWYAMQPAPAREVHRPPGNRAPGAQPWLLAPEPPQKSGGPAPRTRCSSRGNRITPPPCPPPQAGEGDVNALSQAEEGKRGPG